MDDFAIPKDIRLKSPATLYTAKNVFIPLFGEFTGDIWHVAAAEILSEYSRNVVDPFKNRFVFRTYFTLKWSENEVGEKTDNSRSKGVTRSKPNWDYLVNIGLKPTLLYVPPAKGPTAAKRANRPLTWEACNKKYTEQWGNFNPYRTPKPEWDKVKQREELEPPSDDDMIQRPDFDGPSDEDYLVHLLASTSVVMMQMQYLGRRNTKLILGYRLSGGEDIPQYIKEKAEKRYNDFERYIKEIYCERKRRVLLFNFRKGDVNTQHDSTVQIFRQVQKMALTRRLVVVAIPLMDAKLWPDVENDINEDLVFDLYEVKNNGKVDNRVKAYFWHMVAARMQIGSEVIRVPYDNNGLIWGIIGGRSGSMDLPALVGMNAFSWEEPFLTATNGDNPLPAGNWNAKHYASQFPQFLRLLNELPMMTTGFLDATKLDVKIVKKPPKKTSRKAPKKSNTETSEKPAIDYVPKKRIYTGLDLTDKILEKWLNKSSLFKSEARLPENLDPHLCLRLVNQYRPKIEKSTRPGVDPPLVVSAVYIDHFRGLVEAMLKRQEDEKDPKRHKGKGRK